MKAEITESEDRDTICLSSEGIADQVFLREVWLRGLRLASYTQAWPRDGCSGVNPANIELVLNPPREEEEKMHESRTNIGTDI